MADEKVPLTTEIGEDGRECATASLENFGCEDDMVYISPRQAIPIIFVPGIMGTPLLATGKDNRKLVNKLEGKWSWFPDNLEWMGMHVSLGGFNRLNAAQKKTLLDPDQTKVPRDIGEPDFSGLNLENCILPKLEMEKRGWGTVILGDYGYGSILNFLETELRTLFIRGQSRPQLKGAFLAFESEIDTLKGYIPLEFDDLKSASNWSYPVYACGYNWLRSNDDSASELSNYIQFVLKDCQTRLKLKCKKVILVTHSMGGLVARRCAQKSPEDILGIIHGVQPTIGAGTAYRRVRAGWEDIIGKLSIGASASQVTPIFTSPGPLQLLPNQLYGNKWLTAKFGSKSGPSLMALPVKDNPYEEIYSKSSTWWRLINPKLIDPRALDDEAVKDSWNIYLKNLTLAEKFHRSLGKYYFSPTYAHFGVDPDHPAWNKIEWILQSGRNMDGEFSPPISDKPTKDLELVTDNGENHITLKQRHTGDSTSYDLFHGSQVKDAYNSYNYIATMSPQDDTGDGTVPTHSGEELSEYVKFSARLKGLDHGTSYDSKTARAMTMHSIISLAKDAEDLC